MSERYFSAQPISSERIALDGPEAHHLLHVMRASIGQSVILFDGSGAEFIAIVEKLGRAEAELRIVERREIDRELPFTLTVGVALPKGDRQKWLVEKLTELGATMLVPLETERGVAQPTASAIDRLQRAVIEAAKQCGRNRLMQISGAHTWADWIAQLPAAGDLRSPDSPPAPRRLLAHPGGVPLSDIDHRAPLSTLFAVGPEGGLTDEEIALALAAGWQQVALGPRILRVETAAVALSAVVALGASPSPS